jgi:hypothetical protein
MRAMDPRAVDDAAFWPAILDDARFFSG